MNAKTEQQIANLKTQTIGVEIEMNHITRKNAAKLAADFFGTGRYEDTARRNGYYTWSAWDDLGREWKFQRDVSIAGADSEKCELVTPILHYEDIEILQELVRRSHFPSRSWCRRSHPHRSEWAHTAKPQKSGKHHGKPRILACRGFETRYQSDATLLPND